MNIFVNYIFLVLFITFVFSLCGFEMKSKNWKNFFSLCLDYSSAEFRISEILGLISNYNFFNSQVHQYLHMIDVFDSNAFTLKDEKFNFRIFRNFEIQLYFLQL